MAGNWVMYGEGNSLARKTIEAELTRVSMLLRSGESAPFMLVIEMGIESVIVVLKGETIEEACEEADAFARGYFRDKARLFEEIAERV